MRLLYIILAVLLMPLMRGGWFETPIDGEYHDDMVAAPDYLGERPPTYFTVDESGVISGYELREGDWEEAYVLSGSAQAKPMVTIASNSDLLLVYQNDANGITVFRERFSDGVTKQTSYNLDLSERTLRSIVGTYDGPVYVLSEGVDLTDVEIHRLSEVAHEALPILAEFVSISNLSLATDGELSIFYATSTISDYEPEDALKVALYSDSEGWASETVPLWESFPGYYPNRLVPLWHGYDLEGNLVVYGYLYLVDNYADIPWPLHRYAQPQFIGKRDAEAEWHFVSREGWQVNRLIHAAFTPDNVLHIVSNQYPGIQFINGQAFYAEFNEYLRYDGQSIDVEPAHSLELISFYAPYSIQADGSLFAFDDHTLHYRMTPTGNAIQPVINFSADEESVHWQGQPGYRYVVEYSYDLENWHHYDRVYYATHVGQPMTTTFAPRTYAPFIASLEWKPMFMRIVAYP